jgi:prolipoprotein diacylglyceryltransferase
MNPTLVLPVDWGVNVFGVFYLLAFAVGGAFVLHHGHRRGWPLGPWLVVMAWWMVGAVVGAKVFSIPLAAWRDALAAGFLPASPGITFLGATAGGICAVGLARRLVGFRGSALDASVPALPIALAAGRMGCLLDGCCFGTAAYLPWSVAYAAGSAAHAFQASSGLLAVGSLQSLPIHPTQLYEIAAMLALGFAAWRWGRFLKKPGSLFWSFAAAYSGYRFLAEFVRQAALPSAGLAPMQLGLVGAAVAFASYVIWRERGSELQPQSIVPVAVGRLRTVLVALPILVLGFAAGDWFVPTEAALLGAVAQAALIVLAWDLARVRMRVGKQWAAVAATGALVFMMAPSAGTVDDTEADRDSTFITLSVGGMKGEYPHVGLCGTAHQHGYRVGGAGVAYTIAHGEDRKVSVGVRAFRGEDTWDPYTELPSTGWWIEAPVGDPIEHSGGSHAIYGVNPYGQLDYQWFGVGLGVNLGSLYSKDHHDRVDGLDPAETDRQANPLRPMQLSLRFGERSSYFVETKIHDHFPGSYPMPTVQFGFGVGLPHDGAVRFGISDAGFYLNPEIGLPGGVLLSPFAAYMKTRETREEPFDQGDRYQLGLSVRYSFGVR